MYAHLERPPAAADRADWVADPAALPGRRATGLVARFGSLPFRQLAGPAGVFFLWPPKARARIGTSPGGKP